MTLAAALVAGLRFAIAFTLVAAGLAKLRDPAGFAGGVRDYRLLPDRLAPLAATGVIGAELLSGGLLLAGVLLWWAAGLALALGLVFAVATAVNLRRHRRLACYCFGGGEPLSPRSLARVLALVAACVAVLAGLAAGVDLTAGVRTVDTLLQATVGAAFVVVTGWLLALPQLRALWSA